MTKTHNVFVYFVLISYNQYTQIRFSLKGALRKSLTMIPTLLVICDFHIIHIYLLYNNLHFNIFVTCVYTAYNIINISTSNGSLIFVLF